MALPPVCVQVKKLVTRHGQLFLGLSLLFALAYCNDGVVGYLLFVLFSTFTVFLSLKTTQEPSRPGAHEEDSCACSCSQDACSQAQPEAQTPSSAQDLPTPPATAARRLGRGLVYGAPRFVDLAGGFVFFVVLLTVFSGLYTLVTNAVFKNFPNVLAELVAFVITVLATYGYTRLLATFVSYFNHQGRLFDAFTGAWVFDKFGAAFRARFLGAATFYFTVLAVVVDVVDNGFVEFLGAFAWGFGSLVVLLAAKLLADKGDDAPEAKLNKLTREGLKAHPCLVKASFKHCGACLCQNWRKPEFWGKCVTNVLTGAVTSVTGLIQVFWEFVDEVRLSVHALHCRYTACQEAKQAQLKQVVADAEAGPLAAQAKSEQATEQANQAKAQQDEPNAQQSADAQAQTSSSAQATTAGVAATTVGLVAETFVQVKDKVDGLFGKGKTDAEAVQEQAEEVVDTVTEAVEPAVEAVQEQAEEVVDAVAEAAEPVVETVQEQAEEVVATVEEAVEETVEPAVEAVQEQAEEVVATVEETVEETLEPAVEPVVELEVEQDADEVSEVAVEEPQDDLVLEESFAPAQQHQELDLDLEDDAGDFFAQEQDQTTQAFADAFADAASNFDQNAELLALRAAVAEEQPQVRRLDGDYSVEVEGLGDEELALPNFSAADLVAVKEVQDQVDTETQLEQAVTDTAEVAEEVVEEAAEEVELADELPVLEVEDDAQVDLVVSDEQVEAPAEQTDSSVAQAPDENRASDAQPKTPRHYQRIRRPKSFKGF